MYRVVKSGGMYKGGKSVEWPAGEDPTLAELFAAAKTVFPNTPPEKLEVHSSIAEDLDTGQIMNLSVK